MATNIVGATGIDKVQDGIIVNADIDTVAASKITGAFTSFTSTGIDDNADAIAITINSSGHIGIGTTDPTRTVDINHASTAPDLRLGCDGDDAPMIIFDSDMASADDTLANIVFRWNNTDTALISGYAGTDTTNKDDGGLKFFTRISGSGLAERLRIKPDGNIIAGQTSGTGYMLGDGDTGIVESGDDSFQVRLAGSNVFMFSGSEGRMRAPTTGAVNVMNAAGSASAPVYSFNDDTNTGMYRAAADQMAFSTGGSQRMRIYDSNNKGAVALTPEFASGPIFNSGQLSFADDVERTYPGVNTGALIAVGYYADNNGARYHHGLFWASYGIGTSTVNVLGDPANRFRGTDTDGNMCCMSAAGSSNFRIKNRLGVTTNVSINIIQMQGN